MPRALRGPLNFFIPFRMFRHGASCDGMVGFSVKSWMQRDQLSPISTTLPFSSVSSTLTAFVFIVPISVFRIIIKLVISLVHSLGVVPTLCHGALPDDGR